MTCGLKTKFAGCCSKRDGACNAIGLRVAEFASYLDLLLRFPTLALSWGISCSSLAPKRTNGRGHHQIHGSRSCEVIFGHNFRLLMLILISILILVSSSFLLLVVRPGAPSSVLATRGLASPSLFEIFSS